jgi:hypothetical protein
MLGRRGCRRKPERVVLFLTAGLVTTALSSLVRLYSLAGALGRREGHSDGQFGICTGMDSSS